jgi:hypothetical protein
MVVGHPAHMLQWSKQKITAIFETAKVVKGEGLENG